MHEATDRIRHMVWIVGLALALVVILALRGATDGSSLNEVLAYAAWVPLIGLVAVAVWAWATA